MPETAHQRLLNRVRENHLLGATQGVLDWDQQTMLPPGGVEFRAQQVKQLTQLSHQKGTAP